MSFTKITILGHVGAAPEIKKLPSGLIVANFSIATNEKYMSMGELKETTSWWRVDALQKGERGLVTEVIQKYVGKGQMVMIEGSPQQEEWLAKDTGIKMRGFKIRIGHPGSTLQLCGGGNGRPAANGTTDEAGVDSTAAGAPVSDGTDVHKDDIPF